MSALVNGVENVNHILVFFQQLFAFGGDQVQLRITAGVMQAAAQAGLASGTITENATTVTSNYTMSTNKNGLSVGPITVASGSSVTVPANSRWVVL